ncbi:MAG TPA: hypothetical protein VF941_02740 [Clostridia bacterium]
MEYTSPQILVYITADKDRVLGGDPLTLLMPEESEREDFIIDIARALRGDVVQLKNGDYMIISS